MTEPALLPIFDFAAQLDRFQTAPSIWTFLRTAGYKLRPPRPRPFAPAVRRAQENVLDRGLAQPHQKTSVLCELRPGPFPTIVLGGFVPDATEQVFLLRGLLLNSGSLYYFNYSRSGFSTDLLCAQLDDLVEELTTRHGRPPVLFSVSFGCGLVLEWLRRQRQKGRTPSLGGLIFVSPVACAEDLLDPAAPKPTTLLGRALKPYMDTVGEVSPANLEKSRAVFTRMFETGAQNKDALQALMTKTELIQLRTRVLNAIQRLEGAGACERVRALKDMPAPSVYFSPLLPPLSSAPTLVLYAEKESSVLTEQSPTRAAFETARHVCFPHSSLQRVCNPRPSPVQHASLIFHVLNFLPPIHAFYRQLKRSKLREAA